VRPEAAARLSETDLFSGLEDAQLAELAGLISPWQAAAGATVFRQGDPGDRLLVLTAGRLEVTARVGSAPEELLGEIEPGQIVGEMSLLVGGPRTASVRALERSAGVSITREAFELLRAQLRPVALELVRRVGETALRRLHDRYVSLAAEQGAGPSEPPADASGNRALTAYTGDAVHDDYVAQILFFRRFTAAEIAGMYDGLQLLYAPRCTPLATDGRLWIVVRGAVETLLRGTRTRVRLAGPGRCVGHLGLSANGDAQAPIESRLRERAVLLEVPLGSASSLLNGEGPGARRFAEAFHEDVVRALIEVQLYGPRGAPRFYSLVRAMSSSNEPLRPRAIESRSSTASRSAHIEK
jgi:CRP-like cAMP-binding protein